MVRQNNGERGKVSVPAKRVPYGKVRSYNRRGKSSGRAETGSGGRSKLVLPQFRGQVRLGQSGSSGELIVVLLAGEWGAIVERGVQSNAVVEGLKSTIAARAA